MVTALNGDRPLAFATAYLQAGFSIIPVKTDGTKSPALSSWKRYTYQMPLLDEVCEWFDVANPPGIGIIGGVVSGGLETLDFDELAETTFVEWCKLVESESPGLTSRLCVTRTPKPGFHARYRCVETPIPGNTKLALTADGKVLIETRGSNGYAIAVGSPAACHESDRPYVYHSGPPLERVQTISASEREVLIRAARSFHEAAPEEPRNAAFGNNAAAPGTAYNRHGPDWADILLPAGWSCVGSRGALRYWRRPSKEKGWSATSGLKSKSGTELLCVFSSNAHPFPGPCDGRTCSTHSKFDAYARLVHGGDHATAARALARLGFGSPRGACVSARPSSDQPKLHEEDQDHLTDAGNAARVITKHGTDVRYCHPWRRWLVWDGKRWLEDQTAEMVRRVRDTQTDLYAEVAARIKELGPVPADDGRRAHVEKLHATLKHCLRWEDAHRIQACLEIARSQLGVPILPGDLDKDAWLLNCANGTLELKNGTLREHCRTDYITALCPTPYLHDAQAPLWEQFLEVIFERNAELVRFIQKLLGYCLVGTVHEHILPIFWGVGANGKSTLVNVIMTMLGQDFAIKASRDLFMARKQDNHPAQLARLFGKRVVIATETHEGARLDEGLVKELTGGDPISARRMREDPWQFNPSHKCILVTNHKPTIRGTDLGIWRRVRLIPFNVSIPEARQDKDLYSKLLRELPGILGWCVRGCLLWQSEGLEPPAIVRTATESYRSEEDVVGLFLGECCHQGPDYRVRASELYTRYQAWTRATGEGEPAGQRKFGEAMTARGFERYTSAGVWYRGVAIRDMEGIG